MKETDPENVPGLNISLALKSLDIEFRAYQKILTSFLNHSIPLAGHLDKAYKQGDFIQTGELAHSIKGSSANIGAEGLTRLAKTIEFSCKNIKSTETSPVKIAEYITKLHFQIEQVKSSIHSIIGDLQFKIPDQPVHGSDPMELSSAFSLLAEALDLSSPIEIGERHQYLLNLLPEEKLETITTKIHNYEYETAKQELESLAKDLNIAL